MPVRSGMTSVLERIVTSADTAAALGSGDLAVLATPRLLAWLEAATCAAIGAEVPAGRSSVGTRAELTHLRASPVGAVVTVRAELVHVDGRLLRFEVVAENTEGVVLGHGQVTRVLVDTARFLARL